MPKPINTIGIIGAGIMGRGIAQIAAIAGLKVLLFDVDAKIAGEALDFAAKMIKRGVEKKSLTEADADKALKNLTSANTLNALSDCDLVIEAIIEDLEIKQNLFQQLEEIISPNAILATNTSSLSISAIASACKHPGRVAGYHFFNPVPLMGLVEVIAGLRTDREIISHLMALAKKLGKTPVEVIDSPGFLVNHAGRGFSTEALRILAEQIADVSTIDHVLRDGVGFRMGPFELLDITALDVSHPVMEQIYDQYYQDAQLRPQPLTRNRLAAGLLGRKVGEGFYEYKDGKKIDMPLPKSKGDSGKIKTILLAGKEEDAAIDLLKGELADKKIELTGDAAKADICVVLPYGEDCTTAVIKTGLPAEKTLALDPCPGFDGKPILSKIAVIMGSPATDKTHLQNFASLLYRDDRPALIINDSPGFIAQRVLALIVNIGAEIAQQAIATPEDIDTAVTLGLGYPKGPLGLGDILGPKTCVEILDQMRDFYNDPRYRISPWLKRRALLSLSLMTLEN